MDSEARLTQHLAHMDSRKLALLCRELAENRKAEDVAVLDVRKLSSVTDYFVIATGTSEPHLRAIENELVGRLTEDHGIRAGFTEGSAQGSWLVMDFFDVIVHVMRKDTREKYDLEGLWGDAPRIRAGRRKAGDPTAKPSKAGSKEDDETDEEE